MEEDEHPSLQLRQQLGDHLLEAGIDPDLLGNSTFNRVVIQGLLLYNVVDKRRPQINDIASGTVTFVDLVNTMI